MAVRPQSLNTPERGLELENRGPEAVQAPADPTPEAEPVDGAAEELRELRERIAQARKVVPGRDGLHCRDCFERGRDAALRMIEGA